MARYLGEGNPSQELVSDDEDLQQIWAEYQADTQPENKNESFRLDCCFCAERFSSARRRFRHEKNCVIGPIERFTCKVCCINFRYEQGLWRHELRHQVPGEGFTRPTVSQQHRGDDFRCQICVAVFRKKVDYVEHIVRVHSNCQCWAAGQQQMGVAVVKVEEVEVTKENDDAPVTCSSSNMGSLTTKLEAEGSEVCQNHPVETIHIEEYNKTTEEVDLFINGLIIEDEPQEKSKRRKHHSSSERAAAELLIPSEDDDDLPLSQLKATTTHRLLHKEEAGGAAATKSPKRPPKSSKMRRKSIESRESDASSFNAVVDKGGGESSCDDSRDACVIRTRRRRCRRKLTNDEQKVCKIPEYRCKLCPKIYCFEKRYLGHLKTEHGIEEEEEVMEEDVGKSNVEKKDNLYSLKDAFLLGYRKHGCKFCKRRFASKEALANHEKCHTPDGRLRIKCTLCSELFVDEQQIKEHKKSVHRDEVTCKFCNKTYAGERNLQTHIELRHTKTKTIRKMTYLCGKCGKNFTSKTALLDHERSDCGKAPIYQCDVCKKFYHSAGSLKGHKSLHTKVKPFLCKFCGKSYRNPGQLRVHERTHTGEKPHKCTFCPKAFSHRETLLTHVTTHTGFKRFMCSGCGKRFACISNLQVHRKAHADTCGLVPNCTKAVGPMDIHVMPPREDSQ